MSRKDKNKASWHDQTSDSSAECYIVDDRIVPAKSNHLDIWQKTVAVAVKCSKHENFQYPGICEREWLRTLIKESILYKRWKPNDPFELSLWKDLRRIVEVYHRNIVDAEYWYSVSIRVAFCIATPVWISAEHYFSSLAGGVSFR